MRLVIRQAMQLKKRAMSLLFCVNRVVFAMSAESPLPHKRKSSVSRCHEHAGNGLVGVNCSVRA